jgi:hypothetical protein
MSKSGLPNYLNTIFPVEIATLVAQYIPSNIKIHSFDCAVKSMGVCTMDLIVPMYPDMYQVNELAYHVSNKMIKISTLEVWDVKNDGKLKIEKIAKILKVRLDHLCQTDGIPDLMIYENQMNVNDKSRTISHFLIYHYAKSEVVRMGPSLKNTIHLGPGLRHSDFLKKYSHPYKGNKMHCLRNFEYFCDVYNIDISHIPNKNRDDVGDAFMQTLAFLKNRKTLML